MSEEFSMADYGHVVYCFYFYGSNVITGVDYNIVYVMYCFGLWLRWNVQQWIRLFSQTR